MLHPKQSPLIGLHKNEYFFDHPSEIQEAIASASLYETNLYQCSGQFWDFAGHLSSFLGVSKTPLSLTHGAEDALWKLLSFFRTSAKTLIVPQFSWDFYDRLAYHLGYQIQKIPIQKQDHQFELPWDDVIANVKQLKSPSVLLLASPNNPTGHTIDLSSLQEFCQNNPHCQVIIDNVYGYPKEISTFPLHLPNLHVLGSFSKFFGLPGLRIGYMVGSQSSLFEFGLGVSPQSARIAKETLNHFDFYQQNRTLMDHFNQKLMQVKFKFLSVFRSEAPFTLIEVVSSHPFGSVLLMLEECKNVSLVYPKIMHTEIGFFIRFGLGPDVINTHIVQYLKELDMRLAEV